MVNTVTQNQSQFLKLLKTKPENFWMRKGEMFALDMFHRMSQGVPAYQDFLKKSHIKPEKIKTISDFKNVPPLNKDNYLRIYPRNMLCWGGKFSETNWIISTTSGSTGEPFYFPRTDEQDKVYALIAETYLVNNFDILNKSTLYIDAFAMGAWIGGVFTYQAIKYVSQHSRNKISIITPGINKTEIYNAIKNLSGDFDQIIIGGYPPYVKDLIDEGPQNGVIWNKYNLKFVFSAEGFSESFRDYILEKSGTKNVYLSSLNHYGTVDMGTMAHETPYTIMLRRLLKDNFVLNKLFFGNAEHQPTVAQYIPNIYFFENVSGNLYCTSDSGYPMVRYDLKDQGGVLTIKETEEVLLANNINIRNEIKKAGLDGKIFNLPMVFVGERSDFIVKLNAANIYPNSIRSVLVRKQIQDKYTGKFTMTVKNDRAQNQYLEVNVELKYGIMESKKDKETLTQEIIGQLLQENSEYKAIYDVAPHRQIPKVIFWPYGHKKYFSSGGKQKWVK